MLYGALESCLFHALLLTAREVHIHLVNTIFYKDVPYIYGFVAMLSTIINSHQALVSWLFFTVPIHSSLFLTLGS